MSLSTKPVTTTSIEDLPWEMISELFEYLPLKDMVVCSQVNKRWHSVYTNFKIHCLVSIDSNPYYQLGKWYNSNQQIRESDQCHPAIFRRLVEKPLLSDLKQLALCGYRLRFDLNEFNRFSRLVRLEIDIDYLDQVKGQLSLPKLKVLAFHTINSVCHLSVDCPELSTLLYHGEISGHLDVKQPETIRKLETRLFGPKLIPFRGVECLVTEESRTISKATLLLLPRLRELRYNQNIECLYLREFNNGPGSADRMKQTLSEFLDEAKKFRGDDFLFICSGFRLSKVNVDQINFGVQIDEETGRERMYCGCVYLKNYQLIEPGALHFIKYVDYIRLMSNVSEEFPRCFSQKFTGIEQVWTSAEVQDADHLLWFLKSLKSLKFLMLESTGLSQEFYDQLPASAQSLLNLELQSKQSPRGDRNELQLNFDFMDQFSGLSQLTIDQPLSLRSLTSFVRSSGRLKESSFEIRSDDFWIKKASDSSVWKILNEFNRTHYQTERPDFILKFFKGIQIPKNYFG